MLKKTPIIAFIALLFILALLSPTFTPQIAYSQDKAATGIPVKCGDIVPGEFINNAEDHIYLLPMQPKESFELALEPLGDDLKTVMIIYGPSGVRIKRPDDNTFVSQAPKLTSGTLSARGLYQIRVTNTRIDADKLLTDSQSLGGVGIYTLSIRCIKSDGSTIEPGDVPQSTPTAAPLPTLTVRAAVPASTTVPFKGVGFPGLAAVDFSEVAFVPLDLDTPTNGVLPLDNQILGFTLDAKANDVLDFSYKRKSGNLNLGIVVLSATNKVLFQASLVTSESLATRFTLPEAGQYTIGIFRISLGDADKPQPTSFQLLAKLNEK